MRGMKIIAIIIGLTLAFTLASETAIYFAWRATGSSKFDTLYGNSLHFPKSRTANQKYPGPSSGILKVATFGGSSTAGAAAERSFADILSFELNRHLGGGNAYVRNYAEGGAPFHGFQAEMAKALMPFYDVFIIYAGHNEWVPPYFQRGGLDVIGVRETLDPRSSWRNKIAKALADARGDIDLIESIRRSSRIYAVAWKVSIKLTQLLTKSIAIGANERGIINDPRAQRPPPTAAIKTLSLEEIDRFLKNFAEDLAAVRNAARQQNKLVIVVGASGDETWPPHFSLRPSGFDDRESDELDTALVSAGDHLVNGRIADAQQLLSPILPRAPRHAFANHLLGQMVAATGDMASSWRHREIAIDEDGFPVRAHSATRHAAAAIADEQFVYIPHPELVRTLIDQGMTARDMWPDIVHPSSLNHAIIVRGVLCAMDRAGRVAGMRKFCEPIDADRARDLRRRYFSEMNIKPEETRQAHADVYRWGVLLSRISAHPRAYYASADWSLDMLHSDAANNSSSRATLYARRAVLWTLQGKSCGAVLEQLSKAIDADPKRAARVLLDDFLVRIRHDLVAMFAEIGIGAQISSGGLSLSRACGAATVK